MRTLAAQVYKLAPVTVMPWLCVPDFLCRILSSCNSAPLGIYGAGCLITEGTCAETFSFALILTASQVHVVRVVTCSTLRASAMECYAPTALQGSRLPRCRLSFHDD